MKKTNKTAILVLVFGLLFLLAGFFFTQYYSVHGNPIAHMKIKNYHVRSEVVADEAKQKLGLGGRSGLCSNCGMLFIFDGEENPSFWMKDMRFAIDILWINGENVVHLERDVPYSDQGKIYVSDKPAHMVLELPAGTCEREGIGEGSQVVFE